MNSFSMKTLAVSAALLASISLVPAASATTLLYGGITTTGKGTLTTTGSGPSALDKLAFGNINYSSQKISGNPNPNYQYYDQSAGTLSTATQDFNVFDSSATINYVACNPATPTMCPTNTHTNGSGAWDQRAPAVFSLTAGQINTQLNGTTGVLFYVMTEGGNTLDFYVTEVTNFVNSAYNKTGEIDGLGYVVLNGNKQAGTFVLKDNVIGANSQPFTMSFISSAPEPTSLALLGTGLLGMAFFIRRKAHAEQM